MSLATIRAMVKELAFQGLGSSAVVARKLRSIRRSGALTILNLHRVSPDDGSAYRPLDPRRFEYLLVFVKRHFHIVTFGELAGDDRSDRPKLILSFDDAYLDFLTVAVPLLEKHGIRVNQNVIPDCIETGLPPLNVLMQDFIGRAPASVVERLDIPGFETGPAGASRAELGDRLTRHLKNRSIAEQQQLRDILLPQVQAYDDFAATPMMSREEVRQVASVHEIGAHSFSHASMGYETDEFLREDVIRCKAYFDDVLHLPLTTYALPNGSYRDEQIKILMEEGVEHVLLVDEDFSTVDGKVHKRFTFDGGSKAEIRFRATGAFKWPPSSGGAQ